MAPVREGDHVGPKMIMEYVPQAGPLSAASSDGGVERLQCDG
jgi:hypothetical protein